MKFSKEIKIGFAAFVAAVILIWGINFMKGKDIFSSKNIYYAVFNSVNGLQVYSPVVLNGLKVGQVKNINFVKNNRQIGDIIIALELEDGIGIPVDSRAILHSVDIMGTMGIKISMGSSNEFIQHKDTLSSEKEKGMFEEFSPIQSNLLRLVESIDTLVSGLNSVLNVETRANFKGIVHNVNNLTEVLDKNIKDILTDVESIISSEKIIHIVDNLSTISDSLSKVKFVSLSASIEEAAKGVSDILAKLDSEQGSLGLLLNDDDLYVNLNSATTNLDRLLQDFKTNPDKYVSVSVFGGKKKVFYVDKEEYDNVFKKDISYKVQVKQSEIPISLAAEFFEGEEVEEILHKKVYMYVVGDFESVEEVQQEYERLLLRFPEAKVVAFKKEDMISLEKAKDI